MADSPASGIQLAQQSRDHRAIERVPTAVAAFVGRTLKGPVDQAVTIRSFNEFQQHFGGLWQPSSLAYAVEQFFENGGRAACIVRVANGARPPTLTLPAGRGALHLTALNPGSREYLRASVDYDGVSASEQERFNLVVQRVRAAGSELVEDQEIYRRLSVAQASGRFVADVLLESRLVRVLGDLPAQRPDRSASGPGGVAIGYTLSNPDGDDGAPLTDYDVIGAAGSGTGLFALGGAAGFNLLCIPPLARDRDVGLSTLLVAARLCREHHECEACARIEGPHLALQQPQIAAQRGRQVCIEHGGITAHDVAYEWRELVGYRYLVEPQLTGAGRGGTLVRGMPPAVQEHDGDRTGSGSARTHQLVAQLRQVERLQHRTFGVDALVCLDHVRV